MQEGDDRPFAVGNAIAGKFNAILVGVQAVAGRAGIDPFSRKITKQLLIPDEHAERVVSFDDRLRTRTRLGQANGEFYLDSNKRLKAGPDNMCTLPWGLKKRHAPDPAAAPSDRNIAPEASAELLYCEMSTGRPAHR